MISHKSDECFLSLSILKVFFNPILGVGLGMVDKFTSTTIKHLILAQKDKDFGKTSKHFVVKRGLKDFIIWDSNWHVF